MSNVLENKINVAGRYRILVSDASSGVVLKDTGWFDNLITNQGMNWFGMYSNAMFEYCRLGSGNSEPAYTDVGLASPFVGYATTYGYSPFLNFKGIVTEGSLRYGRTVQRYDFAAGAVVGTVREVSVGRSGSNNTSAFSRSLIKSNGVPIELVVTATDLVTVYYEVRNYHSIAPISSSVIINGVTYGVTIQGVNVNSTYYWAADYTSSGSSPHVSYTTLSDYNYWSKDNTTYPSSSGFSSITSSTYVPNSYERSATGIINNGTSAIDVKAMSISQSGNSLGYYLIVFNPHIPKAANQKLSLTAKLSWGRYAI